MPVIANNRDVTPNAAINARLNVRTLSADRRYQSIGLMGSSGAPSEAKQADLRHRFVKVRHPRLFSLAKCYRRHTD